MIGGCARAAALALLALGCARPSSESSGSPGSTPSATADAPPPALTPGASTGPAISEEDLRTRVAIFADDSMMGRNAPLEGDRKGSEYLARELHRLGLEPAGDSGSYFQTVPSIDRSIRRDAVLGVGGQTLRHGVDFIPASRSTPRSIEGAQVVYGGSLHDPAGMITRQQAAGKFVVLSVTPGRAGSLTPVRHVPRIGSAAGIAVVSLDEMSAAQRAALDAPESVFAGESDAGPHDAAARDLP